MSAAPYFHPREINAVRVRVGLFGHPVLQIRRSLVRYRFLASGETLEVPYTKGGWEDATREDIPELAVFLERQTAPINGFPAPEPAP